MAKELTKNDIILVALNDAQHYHSDKYVEWKKKRSKKAKMMQEYHLEWCKKFESITEEQRQLCWREHLASQ